MAKQPSPAQLRARRLFAQRFGGRKKRVARPSRPRRKAASHTTRKRSPVARRKTRRSSKKIYLLSSMGILKIGMDSLFGFHRNGIGAMGGIKAAQTWGIREGFGEAANIALAELTGKGYKNGFSLPPSEVGLNYTLLLAGPFAHRMANRLGANRILKKVGSPVLL